jgi:hypothetical protein
MSKFFIKLFVFLLPLAILLGITEYKARFIESGFEKKRKIADEKIESAEILIFGSSHTYYGVKAAMLGKPALNFAYPSQDLYYDDKLLQKYLPLAKNLKIAVIDLAYPSFEVELEKTEWIWRTSAYERFWKIPRKSKIPLLTDYSLAALYGIQESRTFLLTNRLTEEENIDFTGSNVNERPANPALNSDLSNFLRLHEANMKESSIPANVGYLSEMIEALQSKNIRVIIISTPCYHNYYEKINSEKYSTFERNINLIREKYNVEYYNFLKDSRFNEQDFVDTDHLTTKGSEKFTLLLKDLINNSETR